MSIAGVDFKVKTLVLNGKRVKLSIWVSKMRADLTDPYSRTLGVEINVATGSLVKRHQGPLVTRAWGREGEL